MRPESAAFLWDVRHAAGRIGTFIAGLTKDDYLVDELRRSALERRLEVIGEALNNLDARRRREGIPIVARSLASGLSVH